MVPPSRTASRSLAGFFLELAMWFGVSGAFLWHYRSAYVETANPVLPHLAIVGTVWLALAIIRLGLYYLLPRKIAYFMGSVLLACGLAGLSLYYGVVLAGLENWGRVISLALITSYAPQSIELATTLGMSPLWLLLGSLLTLAILNTLVMWIHRTDWVLRVRRASPILGLALVIFGASIVSVRFYAFAAHPPTSTGEPISLTLFPEQAVRRMQDTARQSLDFLERAEREARKTYTVNGTATRRNIILIVSDALRPDHMGVNGYARETTPFLSSLARQGRIRTTARMVAACAESSCGLLALATGRYVHQFTGSPMTLHEVLRLHGYGVWMILGGDHTNFYGLRDAYGVVDHYFDGSYVERKYANDDQLVVDHVASLPKWDGEPLMMQIHLMSSHGLGTRRPEASIYQPAVSYYGLGEGRGIVRARRPDVRATNYYDNGVRTFDAVLEEIVGSLRSKGYLENATLVVTADHGELLGEHGQFSHSRTVYEEVLRVPFLMIDFGYEGESFGDIPVASQADIAPTVLHELDIPIPSTWSGRPLQHEPKDRYVYFQQGMQVGLFDASERGVLWKYFVDVASKEEFVFDLTTDPRESTNRANDIERGLLARWRREALPAVASVVPEHSEALARK